MNIDLETLEGIEAYDVSNFKESDSISPLCFIIDGILDIESFNIFLKDLKRFKPTSIQIFKGVYFLSLEIEFNYFKSNFIKKFQSMNYSLHSFFLKRSLSESIINHFSFVKEYAYYLFYEEKENFITNTEIFPNTIKILTTSTHPRKILYEFSNFFELATNYSKLMQAQKNFHIYAILPIKFALTDRYRFESSFKSANDINRSIYPLFLPFQSVYYVSFIEQFPPKPQRKINVEELYSIKKIFDVQISHLLQFEPNNIRTFLGFDNKFRCLHVFDYLINQKCYKKVIFINKDQIEKPELINIKFNLFYIEIQNIFDSSLLFSIEYQNSFLFNNNSFCSNDFSTFLSFEKEDEMKKAKQMIKSLIRNNSPYVIKMLKFIDQKDILLLFPNEKLNEDLSYMIIRLKYLNKTGISKLNNEFLKHLQKISKIVRYDLVPSLNNKRYFVVGFDNNQKRNNAFLILKSKQSMLIQCYYNENLSNRKKLKLNVKEKEQKTIKKEPLFKPKDGMFYIYFEEYQRSKLNYPSSNIRPLFGIQNISDLQRNYFLSNDPKEYTFIGFDKEENIMELINQITLKKHIICSNALDGKIYRFFNNDNKVKIGINNKNPNLFKDTQKIINNSNVITLNSNDDSIEINKNCNSNSNKINQNINENSYKVNLNNNSKSNIVNQNDDNSNKVNQNKDNISNKVNQNSNKHSNDINQNNNDYSNDIDQNNNNYSNKIASNNIIDSNNVISKKANTKALDEKDKITEIEREDMENKYFNKDYKSPKTDIIENNIKTPIQNKLVNNIYYNYINQKENYHLKIDLKKYEVKNLLGNGSYGDVFIVEEKTTSKKYAAKISKNNMHEDFIQEIYFYSKYKYPFILSIHGYSLTDFKNKNHITIVLDYMPNGSLEEALKKSDPLSKPDKYLIMYGIVIGMKYLHSKSVVHRDLKPANILLDENNYPRICDFGLSIIYSDKNKIVKKQEKEKVGSLMYMAPEIFLDKEPYSFKVDVYAFSMIAYQLLTGKEPYSDKNYKSHVKFKKDVIDGVRPDISFIPDSEIRSFFKRCWSQEPSERPSFSQIYDMITAYKFRSVFNIFDYHITKFDYWYKNILNPFELDDSIIREITSYISNGLDLNIISECYFPSIFHGDLNLFGIYGFRMFHGIGVPKNINVSIAIMKYAAKNGDTNSLYLFAHCLHEIKPYDPNVFLLFKKAADKGHVKSMDNYAKLLLEHYDTPKTDMEAAKYFQMSAMKGSAQAMCCYGTLLDLGIGVEKNQRKALEYFQLSAEFGCTEGIYQYAFHVEKGLGCQIDYVKASKYYEIASFYGDIKSMVCLGKMFNNGKLDFNIDQSIKYLREASKYEDAEGMFEYGKALMIQVINNKDDIELPIKFYLKSIKKNNPDAYFSYGNLVFLNAFFNFLGDANSITDSLKYFQNALFFSENKEIPMSFCAFLTNQIIYNNETVIQKNIETIIVEYGILILKNTLENHDLIIDCLLYYMIVKYFKQQYYETINKIIDKIFPNKSHYLKYIIKSVDSYSYLPYSNKCIVKDVEDDVEFNELKLFAKSQMNNKSIKDVKVNVYESFALDEYCCFSFSQSTIPKGILKEVDKYFKSLPEFISVHPYVCNPEDSNDLFTFYKLKLFSSKIPVNEYCARRIEEYFKNENNENWEIDQKEEMNHIMSTFRITQIHMQFEPIFERKGFQVAMGYCSGMPLDQNYLYFNEDYLPNDLLTHLLNYLHTIEDIRSIIPKVYNGRQIVTMIYIKSDTERKIVEKIKNFLSPKDILFKTFEYPLQRTIVLNENMIFRNKIDFLCILNEIESIGIKPINVERDKLYLYEEFYLRKLFQKFSFICFKHEIDKMRALNHINSIVYKGKKNVLQYNLDLNYASLNDRCFPKYVRDLVPKIFQQIKGFCDIQRYVLSIESPVERTYVGFDSHKHLKKCYYKFTYKKNLFHFRSNTDNVFWRKNNYKYLMIKSNFYQDILDQYPAIIKQIIQSSKDFQENCRELDRPCPESEKRNILVYYNFIGYESNEDLDKAFSFLENNVLNAKQYYKKYREGYSYVDVINDPKEAYLFYNSL